MCGILALFADVKGHVSTDDLLRANASIRHRGPDDEGYFVCDFDGNCEVFGGEDSPDYSNEDLEYLPKKKGVPSGDDYRILLGHRRLSIIDLSIAGHQPMSYGDKRYWIVYNGEIYNYVEIKEELTRQGCTFRSRSDTEVILAAYDKWGPSCVDHFNGMWAFVIVDLEKRTAFISRDRFGVKPLYYWRSGNGFISFSSEIKAFTKLPGWNPILNAQRAYDFLVWDLMDHTDQTLFKDIYQVQPGHNATLNIDNIEELDIEPYYDINVTDHSSEDEGAVNSFRALLRDSIRLRMRSDVVVGSCLSGGLDSSSIVSLADEMVKEKDPSKSIHTFTSCSKRKEYDESQYVDELVSYRGLRSFKVTPDEKGLISELENVIWYQDEPFRSTSTYAGWCVFRMAAQNGMKVMLDGQGADEYLCGYEGFIYPRLLELVREFDIRGFTREIRGLKKNQGIGMSHLMSKVVDRVIREHSGASDVVDINRYLINPAYPIANDPVKTSEMRKFTRGQLKYSSLPRLLHWEDRNSMAWSVESRVPFLDYRLVEYTVNLPSDLKIDKGMQKVILRKAMDGMLPPKIVERKDKMGFVTPERYWLTEGDTEEISTMVHRAFSSMNGFVKPEAFAKIDDMIKGKRDYEPWAWRFIIFGLWMGVYGVKVESST